ncbi:unnamed protein product, partial [Ascophyllum nodosum]
VWDNIHGVFAHCAGAKTYYDGSKFKNATTAGVEHIDVKTGSCTWIMKILIIMVLCCARFNYCIG